LDAIELAPPLVGHVGAAPQARLVARGSAVVCLEGTVACTVPRVRMVCGWAARGSVWRVGVAGCPALREPEMASRLVE